MQKRTTQNTLFFYTVENLWEAIHNGNKKDAEQELWNHAMDTLGVRWNKTIDIKKCGLPTGWQSYEPLASIVFPQSVFCRQCCTAEHSSEYYLVHLKCRHKLSLRVQKLKKMNIWFLRHDWKDSINSHLEGNSWLISIYST